RGVHRVSLDTSIFLAQASASDPRQALAQWLVDQVHAGRFDCVISAVSVAEMLVRPSAANLSEAIMAQSALRSFPHLRIASFTLDLAVDTAHVRATTKLKMPDAIVLATAMANRIEAIVHADDEWDKKAAPYASSLKIINLDHHRLS
ncbi:MAG: type II toxin-antitoxin system VapC family toxin, partial [Candidatus Limnocylindria bacterium]|nr:type II toxin-antitoxin system VapC family toxin [Candidatus Limnocylindria bacterium]